MNHTTLEQGALARAGRWHRDGEDAEYFVSNLTRSMAAWGTERVTGNFYIVRDVPRGTLVVDERRENVYLVLGMASVIGAMCHALPHFARITILPVFEFLVYDGLLTPPVNVLGGGFEGLAQGIVEMRLDLEVLDELVETHLREGRVITMGKSAAAGLWDGPPPPCKECASANQKGSGGNEEKGAGGGTVADVPCDGPGCGLMLSLDTCKRCSRCHVAVYCGVQCQKTAWKKGGHKQACSVLKEEKERAMLEEKERAAEASTGGKGGASGGAGGGAGGNFKVAITRADRKVAAAISKVRGKRPQEGFYVVRRMGYSLEENPQRGAVVMHMLDSGGHAGTGSAGYFEFKGPGATYTLSEVLRGLQDASKPNQANAGVGGFVQHVQVDEITVVEPLRKALAEYGIEVTYYPPPSLEEQAGMRQ